MRRRAKQQGATLVLALCMLVVMLILGVSAAQLALQGERAARAERDRHMAFQAAEEALMDAQTDIEGRPGAPGRSAVFDSVASFADNCAADASVSAATATATAEHLHAGLCQFAAAGAPALWQLIALDAQEPGATVEYGRFTGAIMASGAGMLPVRRLRYLVELLPSHLPGEEAGTTAEGAGGGASTGHLYRITAIGFGAQADTQVVLQSYYRKRTGSTPVSGAVP